MNFSVSMKPYSTASLKQNVSFQNTAPIQKQSCDSVAFTGKSDSTKIEHHHYHGKKKHPVKKVMTLGLVGLTAFSLHQCMSNHQPQDLSIGIIEENANDMLLNLKFEKADLLYDINNILDGEKLSQNSLDLYMGNISSEKSATYMSENTGQMMDVLAIASISDCAKDQVSAEKLKPFLVRALQYDEGSLFNDMPDAVSGAGEPWHYIAAAIIAKEYPDLVDYMPEKERKALADKGFFESVWGDLKNTFGKPKTHKQYLGDILKNRDLNYAVNILSSSNNWPFAPSDNPWFGPAAVGYAVRGKLDNLKGMSLEEIEKFRVDYATNKDNQIKFSVDDEYAQKVISSYIMKYMDEAITQNSGKISSGMSALGLQQAGYFNDKLSSELITQISNEAPKMHWFENETKKLDAGIKTYVIAKDGKYSLLDTETRTSIRNFQVNNPKSTATSVFMLAEETYFRELSNEIAKHDALQVALSDEISKTGEERDLDAISDSALELQKYNTNLLVSINKEIKVAEHTLDKTMLENFQSIKDNLTKQNTQLASIIANVAVYRLDGLKKQESDANSSSVSGKNNGYSFDNAKINIGKMVTKGEEFLGDIADKISPDEE